MFDAFLSQGWERAQRRMGPRYFYHPRKPGVRVYFGPKVARIEVRRASAKRAAGVWERIGAVERVDADFLEKLACFTESARFALGESWVWKTTSYAHRAGRRTKRTKRARKRGNA